MVFRIKQEAPKGPSGVPREPLPPQKRKDGPSPRPKAKAGTIGDPIYFPNIPVGAGSARGGTFEPSVPSVPRIPTVPARPPKIVTDRPIAKQSPVSESQILQAILRGGIPVVAQKPVPQPPVISRPVPAGAGRIDTVIQQTTNGGKPVDLGQVLVGLGGQYIQARYGQPQVQQAFMPSLGIPGVEVIKENVPKGMVYDPNADCGEGKWIKRSRRRRKRLATQTDIRDLSALKGVLGSGEAFKVWIATHSN